MSRRGWVYAPEVKSVRKKEVRMLAEGSTFTQKVKQSPDNFTTRYDRKLQKLSRTLRNTQVSKKATSWMLFIKIPLVKKSG